MTDFEKTIYNTWLAVTRSSQGKPFKLRKTWKDAEEQIDYMSIKKLAKMFMRYDNINIDEWFKSPYSVYPETTVQYDLKFYTQMKAFNCYRLHKTKFTKLTSEQFKESLYKKKQVD
jgi:hypothetical protein